MPFLPGAATPLRRPAIDRARARLVAAVAGGACALLLAACTSTAPPTWTMAPAARVAPATATPSAPPSPSPAATPEPTASPAPSPSSTAPAASASPSAPASASPSPGPVAGGWTFVKQEKCPESRFECVTLSVPSDHTTAGSAPWDVSFAIQRATGKRLGTFVVIAGGPGGSGIAIADSYTDDYPARIAEHYDFVYPDQRGIGLSHPIGCPDATAAYYTSPIDPQDPAQGDAAGAAAKSYADACIAEAKIPEAELPLYATTQAVEDLEAIRDYLGVDKLDLYGESYGTQFVQTYAAAYPEHIRTLYLDGPVDLTLDGETFYGEAVRAFDDALVATAQRVCRAAARAAPTSRARARSRRTTRSPRSSRRARSTTTSRWAMARSRRGRSPRPTSRTRSSATCTASSTAAS